MSAPSPQVSQRSRDYSAQLYADALTTTPRIAPPPKRKRASSSLFRLIPYMRPYTARWVWMVILALAFTLAGIITPLVSRALIDGPIRHHSRSGVLSLGLVALLLGVAQAVLEFIRRWIVSVANLGTETGIRLELYAKLQRLPMDFHRKWQSGQLLSRIMNDLGTVRRFLGFGMLFLVMNAIQIVVVVTLLLQMYLPLGLIVVAAIIPVAGFCVFMQRRLITISRAQQDQVGDVASSIEENVQGLRVIKAFGRMPYMFGGFDKRAVQLYDTSIRRVNLTAFFWTFLEVIPNLTLVVVLGVGAWAAANHQVTLGTLVAFIQLLLSLIWPVASMGFLLSMVQEAMTAADRVVEVFDATETIHSGTRELTAPRGELVLRDVAYRFPDAATDDYVLHDVTLALQPGETVAVVGGTGSGKTTLTALIPRLIDVDRGSVEIDGVDVRELTLSNLRSIVATAFEDPTLFSISARENLKLGRLDATDEEIAEAIEVAQAQFVYDLPFGLDTRIGEQGMSLSGGQRQRLALARAVLVQPKILVLDDTLSALDIHTEALVEEALKRVLVGVTGIVVAHRASTVLLADRVALLQHGTITHVGTHADLLATVPEYRELLSAEFDAEGELGLLNPEVSR